MNKTSAHKIPARLAVFPLRDTVIFPDVPAQLSTSRPHTIQTVTKAFEQKKMLAFVVSQHSGDTPTRDDLLSVGTAATIQHMWHLPDGSIRLLVHGICRIQISKVTARGAHLYVQSAPIAPPAQSDKDLPALCAGVSGLFQKLLSLSPQQPEELQIAILNIDDPNRLADFVAFHLSLSLTEQQKLLQEPDPAIRLQLLSRHLTQEIEVLELGAQIRSQVQSELDRNRREHLIREQIRALQHELGETDTRALEIQTLRQRLAQSQLTPEANKEAHREIDRIERMPPGASEYTTSRTYIDWLLDLPWQTFSQDNLDLKHAQRILDRDHSGLKPIKNRLLDEIAIRKLGHTSRNPVLCFVGPPGVGKTSLAQSIATALNRQYVRIALGGLRDEATLRGHRRTYIGAMPGRIIQGLHRCGTLNPVMVLDEVDKLSTSTDDLASALLEILDPDQNTTFADHYLNVAFDLSHVIFIATANVLSDIPDPLRDRLEIIELSGYLETEKAQIVRRHLLPRQQSAHGLKPKQLNLKPDAIRSLINHYTREPGLRNLDRALATLCRKTARQIAENDLKNLTLTAQKLSDYLGTPPFPPDMLQPAAIPGLAIGLAATRLGGEHFAVEATTMSGTGNLQLTGHLGDVMKESAHTALSYVRTQMDADPIQFDTQDIHIHVPAGAVPKDGPSAGLAMVLCLISLFRQKPLRPSLATTGEITLTGRILPVGGLSDKVLAARRANIKHIILPETNRSDIASLPQTARSKIKFHFVETIDQAIKHALA